MAQLCREYDGVRRLGADIVALGTGDATAAAAFVAEMRPPFPVLADEHGVAAAAAGVGGGDASGVLTPGALVGALRAWRAGHRQRATGARPLQLGATFVLGPGAQMRYAHLDRHVGDHAPGEAVLDALRAISGQP